MVSLIYTTEGYNIKILRVNEDNFNEALNKLADFFGLLEEDREYTSEEILNIFKEENTCDIEHFYAILANEYTIILSDNFEGIIELD